MSPAPRVGGGRPRIFPPLPPRTGPDAPFASSWWGNAWIDALEGSALDPARLARGRAYAREGHVDTITVESGRIIAYVHGSRPRPYRAELRMRTFTPDDWDRFLDAATADPAHLTSFLTRDMPQALAATADRTGVPLLPGRGDLIPSCTCPDRGHPCKHAAALTYQTARILDADPFVLLLVRGGEETRVLEELTRRNARAAASEATGGPAAGRSAARSAAPTLPEGAVRGGGEEPVRMRAPEGAVRGSGESARTRVPEGAARSAGESARARALEGVVRGGGEEPVRTRALEGAVRDAGQSARTRAPEGPAGGDADSGTTVGGDRGAAALSGTTAGGEREAAAFPGTAADEGPEASALPGATATAEPEAPPLPGTPAREALATDYRPPLPPPLPVPPHPGEPPLLPALPGAPDPTALEFLATDAAQRAHAYLMWGVPALAAPDPWHDAVRLAASHPGLTGRRTFSRQFAALADSVGRTPTDLSRAAAAWRQGAEDGLAVLESPWDPPAGPFDRARGALTAADLPRMTIHHNHLTDPTGTHQLRYGQDGRWYPYRGETQANRTDWWPEGQADEDPVGAYTSLLGA
ncbi:SWIM zinc finger family protein [Streptomyces lasiicapitis]|uniref:SWIM zinc finger family protein n=1 Tax=Streptomyces lasiicapitis TaxID=1923961 RepID=UPI003658DFA9